MFFDSRKLQSSGFGLISLIIAVVIITVLAGGGLYWNETQQKKSLIQQGLEAEKRAKELRDKISQQQKQQHEAIGEKPETQQSSPIDTSSWKIYRNEKYGFEVRYPAIGDAQEIRPRSSENEGGSTFEFFKFYHKDKTHGFVSSDFGIGVFPNKNNSFSLQEWFVKSLDYGKLLLEHGTYSRRTLLDGTEIFEWSGKGVPAAYDSGPLPTFWVMPPLKKYIFDFSFGDDHDLDEHGFNTSKQLWDTARQIMESIRMTTK